MQREQETKIIRALRGDIKAVKSLVLKLIDELEPINEMEPMGPGYDNFLEQYLRNSLNDEREIILLAVEDGEYAGVSETRLRKSPSPAQPKSYGYITWFYVRPEYRRRGIGRRLLEATRQQLKIRGAEQLRLGALSKNSRAIEFWDAMGFDPGVITMFRSI